MPQDTMQAKFKRLDPQVEIPTTAHIGDAAVDLQCRLSVVLDPGQRAAVPTGLAVAIPTGFAGLVLPRSGHANRSGIGVVNSPGLIDSGYRGEIKVLLINHGSEPVSFEVGDRIAQLTVVPVASIEWIEVDDLDETPRGVGGFGSTGT
jgi:dUTP pyrophosphatase